MRWRWCSAECGLWRRFTVAFCAVLVVFSSLFLFCFFFGGGGRRCRVWPLFSEKGVAHAEVLIGSVVSRASVITPPSNHLPSARGSNNAQNALHSAIRGGTMFTSGVLSYAERHGYISKWNIKEGSLAFTAISSAIAILGFWWQFRSVLRFRACHEGEKKWKERGEGVGRKRRD